MTHLITGACCKDAACVSVCPVDCIHPAPGEPDYASAEMLYIDPVTCNDCGACIDVCPVDAVSEDYRLTDDVAAFERLADLYFAAPAPTPSAEESHGHGCRRHRSGGSRPDRVGPRSHLGESTRDQNLRSGVVSMSFAYRGAPPAVDSVERVAHPTVNALISVEEFFDPYSGQPRMTGVDVDVVRQ